MHFASFLSGGFATMVVINPPKRKVAKCTSVHSAMVENNLLFVLMYIYSVTSKPVEDFFQIFLAFSEKPELYY